MGVLAKVSIGIRVAWRLSHAHHHHLACHLHAVIAAHASAAAPCLVVQLSQSARLHAQWRYALIKGGTTAQKRGSCGSSSTPIPHVPCDRFRRLVRSLSLARATNKRNTTLGPAPSPTISRSGHKHNPSPQVARASKQPQIPSHAPNPCTTIPTLPKGRTQLPALHQVGTEPQSPKGVQCWYCPCTTTPRHRPSQWQDPGAPSPLAVSLQAAPRTCARQCDPVAPPLRAVCSLQRPRRLPGKEGAYKCNRGGGERTVLLKR